MNIYTKNGQIMYRAILRERNTQEDRNLNLLSFLSRLQCYFGTHAVVAYIYTKSYMPHHRHEQTYGCGSVSQSQDNTTPLKRMCWCSSLYCNNNNLWSTCKRPALCAYRIFGFISSTNFERLTYILLSVYMCLKFQSVAHTHASFTKLAIIHSAFDSLQCTASVSTAVTLYMQINMCQKNQQQMSSQICVHSLSMQVYRC